MDHKFADGSDYVGGPFSVNFGTNANDVQCRQITILSDNEREDHENFFVDLDLSDTGRIRRRDPSRTLVTIQGTKVAFHSHIH